MFSFFKSTFLKLSNALTKTRALLTKQLHSIFKKPLSSETLEELEKTLFEADLGSGLTTHLIESVERLHRKNPAATGSDYLEELEKQALALFEKKEGAAPKTGRPHVNLIVGVNGSGKTTTIAKLAYLLKKKGQKVLLVAADTFRAAAIEQLDHWAGKIGVDIVKGKAGGDPASAVFEGLSKGGNYDTILIDTAGRLQAKTDLMRELEKVLRICDKALPGAPHEVTLVLDATMGQNGIDQAKTFHQFAHLTGLILTKLDGSAKGGVALAITHAMGLPIHYIGLGEGLEDLEPFDSTAYVEALFKD